MTANAEAASPSFFTNSQMALIRSVLDRIIPPDEAFPGAGELGVADYIDRVVGESAELKRLFTRGLAQINIAASQVQPPGDFTELRDDGKDAILRQVEPAEPEFFEALIRHTYNGYYTNPRVIDLLGLEAQPPQPRGHQLEQGDLSLIENVKRRGQAYREV